MQTPEWQLQGSSHIWMPYTQMKTALAPLAVERTEGCCLILSDGRRLIDGISSWWTACHGYNHPYIVEAVAKQLETMPHVMFGGLQHEPAMNLAARITNMLPGDLDRVFFSDSGSVAVEVALKMAVQYWINRGEPGKNRFVCFVDSYHGDTAGAMSVCDPVDSMHSHFKGFLLEQYPYPIPSSDGDVEAFKIFLESNRHELAGVIIEPLVQAAGGMRFHSPARLKSIADCCAESGLLLIADEIATGFGRTGTMFAIEQADVVPDIICLGKALTGGLLGMAMTVARESVYEVFHSDDYDKALMHGPTFMANPLACAAANASMDLFEREPRLEQVASIEEQLETAFSDIKLDENVLDVRVLGAVAAVQLKKIPNKYAGIQLAIDNGTWIRPLRDVVYLMPPFVIQDNELSLLCDVARQIVDLDSGE